MSVLFRYTIIITCSFTILNAIMFVGISAYRSVHAYILVFQGKIEERPGVHLVEALDGFLLAVVFMIFAIGFGKLFLPDHRFLKSIHIAWLQPKSFSDLKHILWEAVLTTLVILFGISIVQDIDALQWTHLVIPASIAFVGIGSRMLRVPH